DQERRRRRLAFEPLRRVARRILDHAPVEVELEPRSDEAIGALALPARAAELSERLEVALEDPERRRDQDLCGDRSGVEQRVPRRDHRAERRADQHDPLGGATGRARPQMGEHRRDVLEVAGERQLLEAAGRVAVAAEVEAREAEAPLERALLEEARLLSA